MMYNILADTAKDGPAHLTEASRSNYNEISVDVFSYLYDVATNTILARFKMCFIFQL